MPVLSRIWSYLSYATIFLLNPITNSRRDALSLGRILLFELVNALLYMLVFQHHILWAIPMGPLFLLSAMFLILAAYCFGDKPWVREVVMAMVQKAPSFNAGGCDLKVEGPADGEAARIAERTEYPPEEEPPEAPAKKAGEPLI